MIVVGAERCVRVEKRKSERFQVHGDISGRVVLASDVDIQDLSTNGIRFICSQRVLPRSRIELVIGKDELKVNIGGVVVRSTLLGGMSGHPDSGPAYEVAATFDSLGDDHRSALEKLVLQLGKE